MGWNSFLYLASGLISINSFSTWLDITINPSTFENNKFISFLSRILLSWGIILSQTAKKEVVTEHIEIESKENIELQKEVKKEIQKEVEKEIASIQNEKIVKEKINKKKTAEKKLSKPELINEEFDDIVKMITNKNKDKPFPDINDFPN